MRRPKDFGWWSLGALLTLCCGGGWLYMRSMRLDEDRANLWRSLGVFTEEDVTNFVKEGGDVDDRNPNGKTMLLSASELGDTESVAILLHHGARTDLKSERGETALDLAQRNHHPDIVQLLKKHGAGTPP